MDEETLNSLVAKYVEEFGINTGNYDELKPLFKDQLRQIEGCLQEVITAQEQIAVALKENKLSTSGVASSAGISRAHIDNHKGTLKKYIDLRIEQIEKNYPYSLRKIKQKQGGYDEIRKWLKRTEQHLLKNEILESKINELEQLNKELQRQVEDYTMQISGLQVANERLSHKLRIQKHPNVVPLTSTKNN